MQKVDLSDVEIVAIHIRQSDIYIMAMVPGYLPAAVGAGTSYRPILRIRQFCDTPYSPVWILVLEAAEGNVGLMSKIGEL